MSNQILDFIAGLSVSIATIPNLGVYFAFNFSLIAIWLFPAIIFLSLFIGWIFRNLTKINRSVYLFGIMFGLSMFFGAISYIGIYPNLAITNIITTISLWISSFTFFRYGIMSKK